MKKTISILAVLSLLLSLGACAVGKSPSGVPQEMVSGGGVIEFSGSSGREPVSPENPPAVPEDEGPSYAPIPSSSVPSYPGSTAPESASPSSQPAPGSSPASSQSPPPSSRALP